MEKQITYNGNRYTIEIKWSGNTYMVRILNWSGWVSIPMNALHDIEAIKHILIEAIERRWTSKDFSVIEEWDGNI